MENRKCKLPGCEFDSAPTRLYCSGHIARRKKTGSFDGPPIKRVPPRGVTGYDVLLFNGYTVTQSGCHEYNGPRFSSGYGQVKINGSPKLAHRVVYERVVGLIPVGNVVRHKCDNPPCINPDHLEVGTTAENNADREIRNRSAKGERAGNAKMKDADVLLMRKAISLENPRKLNRIFTYYSEKFGVSRNAIQRAWLRSTYAHIPGGYERVDKPPSID